MIFQYLEKNVQSVSANFIKSSSQNEGWCGTDIYVGNLFKNLNIGPVLQLQ